jgi:hypothetical protein
MSAARREWGLVDPSLYVSLNNLNRDYLKRGRSLKNNSVIGVRPAVDLCENDPNACDR